VGWIYATRDRLRKEFGVRRLTHSFINRAKEILRSEVEIYDMYLTGEVYGFTIYKIASGHIDIIDSCGGFYSDDPRENGMLDYVPAELRTHLAEAGHIYSGLVIVETGEQFDSNIRGDLYSFLVDRSLLDPSVVHAYDVLRNLYAS